MANSHSPVKIIAEVISVLLLLAGIVELFQKKDTPRKEKDLFSNRVYDDFKPKPYINDQKFVSQSHITFTIQTPKNRMRINKSDVVFDKTTLTNLFTIAGPPDRVLKPGSKKDSYIYDSLGFYTIADQSAKILMFSIWFRSVHIPMMPEKDFTHELEIDGVKISGNSTRTELFRALKLEPQGENQCIKKAKSFTIEFTFNKHTEELYHVSVNRIVSKKSL